MRKEKTALIRYALTYYSRFDTCRIRYDPELAAQQRKAEFENSQRCYSEGSRAYAEYVTMHAEGRALPGWEIIWDEPETHYDRKTDTCLVQIASVKHLADPS